MPLLGFQARFAPLVESGEKRQTIRAYRKDGRDPKGEDRLYFWTGLRRPGARKLGEATCVGSCEIWIGEESAIVVDGWALADFDRDRLARADGFGNAAELVEWFRANHGLPFRGLLIEWGKLEEGAKR